MILKDLFAQSQYQTIVSELDHYIRLSKTAPQKFENLKQLIDFMSTISKD